jgi:hypothetical protein
MVASQMQVVLPAHGDPPSRVLHHAVVDRHSWRIGRIDRSRLFYRVRLDGDLRSDGRYLEISASAWAKGTTDWGWPPTYGSGPYGVTPHPVLRIDSARERRAPSRMKERGRAAGAGIAQGIGAL